MKLTPIYTNYKHTKQCTHTIKALQTRGKKPPTKKTKCFAPCLTNWFAT